MVVTLNEKGLVIICGLTLKQGIPKLFQDTLKFPTGLQKKSADFSRSKRLRNDDIE